MSKRVKFEFDERSMVSIDRLKKQGAFMSLPPDVADSMKSRQKTEMLETTLARLEEAAKMPPIIQSAAYSAIRIDLRDFIKEMDE